MVTRRRGFQIQLI